jgi:hypothetical protein
VSTDGGPDRQPSVLVPADLEVEDRIVGPVTFRLAGWLAAAAVGTALAVLSWPNPVASVVGGVLIVIGVTGGFYRPGARPVAAWARPLLSYRRRARRDRARPVLIPSDAAATGSPLPVPAAPPAPGPHPPAASRASAPRRARRTASPDWGPPSPPSSAAPVEPAPIPPVPAAAGPRRSAPAGSGSRVAARTAVAITLAVTAGVAVPIRLHRADGVRPATPTGVVTTQTPVAAKTPTPDATLSPSASPSPSPSPSGPDTVNELPLLGCIDLLLIDPSEQCTLDGSPAPAPSGSASGSGDLPWSLGGDGSCASCG